MINVEMRDCFNLYISRDMLDNDIIREFMKFCIDNDIRSLRVGGVSSPTVYIHNHRLSDKGRIVDFFVDRGINVDVFSE